MSENFIKPTYLKKVLWKIDIKKSGIVLFCSNSYGLLTIFHGRSLWVRKAFQICKNQIIFYKIQF